MHHYDEHAALLLHEKLIAFDKFIEPHLGKLKREKQLDLVLDEVPELQDYLDICAWPLRKLEYAQALQCLLAFLKPGDRYLDAGCGASPLSHAVAEQQITTQAYDISTRLMRRLRRPAVHASYGTKVNYAVGDITKLHEADATFDAISCISVLDHLPTPKVRRAMHELMRVLKPGGLLVITLGFRTTHNIGTVVHSKATGCKPASYRFYGKLLAALIESGALVEIYSESIEDLSVLQPEVISTPLTQPNPVALTQVETSKRLRPKLLPLTLALQKPE